VQGNHLHLIAEARDAQRLARGMQGLATRAAANLAVARGAASIENQNLESLERVASA
jgi:hypothetical protein